MDMTLDRYLYVDDDLKELETEYWNRRDEIISGCFPQQYVEGFDIKRSHYGTEDAGIELAELSIMFEKRKKRISDRKKKLKQALTILDPEEKDAFNLLCYGQPSELDYWRKFDLYVRAKEKLTDYLINLKEQELQEEEEQRKNQLRKQIVS